MYNIYSGQEPQRHRDAPADPHEHPYRDPSQHPRIVLDVEEDDDNYFRAYYGAPAPSMRRARRRTGRRSLGSVAAAVRPKPLDRGFGDEHGGYVVDHPGFDYSEGLNEVPPGKNVNDPDYAQWLAQQKRQREMPAGSIETPSKHDEAHTPGHGELSIGTGSGGGGNAGTASS